MTLAAPEDFVQRFGAAWAARDASAIAQLCASDVGALSLTGGWADSRDETERLWAADFAGALARSRLVTGKGRLHRLSDRAAMLHQRFVLSGISDAEGHNTGRLGMILSAVIEDAGPGHGWLLRSLIVAPLA